MCHLMNKDVSASAGLPDNRLRRSLEACFDDVKGAWRNVTEPFMESARGKALVQFVNAQVASGEVVFPATPFLALTLTPLESVRVVILGQDPYHGAGQAQGLAFSVSEGVKIPPSLRNIFKEQQRDLGITPAANGSLVHWAKQGVLLLNATLTVKEASAASHAKKGWEQLTDALIEQVAQQRQPVVFMLWGAHAQAKSGLIDAASQQAGVKHLVLKANHPSPLSATKPPVPFIGCGHFSQANAFLVQHQKDEITWEQK